MRGITFSRNNPSPLGLSILSEVQPFLTYIYKRACNVQHKRSHKPLVLTLTVYILFVVSEIVARTKIIWTYI
ncbi:hypothetical protein FKM82_004228 [Ascaphus truei]